MRFFRKLRRKRLRRNRKIILNLIRIIEVMGDVDKC